MPGLKSQYGRPRRREFIGLVKSKNQLAIPCLWSCRPHTFLFNCLLYVPLFKEITRWWQNKNLTITSGDLFFIFLRSKWRFIKELVQRLISNPPSPFLKISCLTQKRINLSLNYKLSYRKTNQLALIFWFQCSWELWIF